MSTTSTAIGTPAQAVTDARADIDSWLGVTPVDVAEQRARLTSDPAAAAYWQAYADEVARLQETEA